MEPVQAGQKVRCACGRDIDVPTMRQLAALEAAHSEEPAPEAKTAGGPSPGLLLAGLLLLAGGLAYALVVYLDRPQVPTLDGANLAQTWQVWMDLRRGVDAGLFKDQETYQQQIKALRLKLGASLAVGAVGALLLLIGLAGTLTVKRFAATGAGQRPSAEQ